MGDVLCNITGIHHQQFACLHYQICSFSVGAGPHRVNEEIKVIIRRIISIRIPFIPVTFSQLAHFVASGNTANVGNNEIWHAFVSRKRWSREIKQRSVRVVRINPEKHLMWQHVLTGLGSGNIALEKARVKWIAEIKKFEVERENCIGSLRTGMNSSTTAK